MLEHLLDFDPPVSLHTEKALLSLEKAGVDDVLNAQVKTTQWLESLGIEDDQKVLKDAEANAARKVFTALATDAPQQHTKTALTQLKTPEAVRHLVTMLSAYDWEFVEQAKNLRGMAVAKILEETNHPDARIRLKALDMLGRVTEVALFTDRVEIKKTEMSDTELDQRIKDKLGRFMGVVEVVDATEIVDIDALEPNESE
tara:strand:+ start:91 stop:690 length:600 start_codon:yes stop_codon:yes gene_type:complete